MYLCDNFVCADCGPQKYQLNYSVPQNFMYPLLSKKRLLPCLATVKIVRKVDCGTYWVIDKSVALLLTKQIVAPICELLPDIEVGKSIACIASVVRPDKEYAKPQFCRAVASNFNKCDGSCTVFLIDYGETLAANVYSLYSLNGQPPIVFEAPGAAFLCVVKQRSQSYQRYAKLVQDETYVIEIFAVDENEKFSTLLYNNVPASELLNDLSETEQQYDEQRTLRGSMLSQWTSGDNGAIRSELGNGNVGVGLSNENPHCVSNCTQTNKQTETLGNSVNINVDGDRLNEKISLALAVAKLETKIDVQHAELSKKLDTLITARLMRRALTSEGFTDVVDPLHILNFRNLNYCDNYYCKQNKCGYRKHGNRSSRSKNCVNYRNFQQCANYKAGMAKFVKSIRKTNEASTQTCIERVDSTCVSRHSLATTTCSSICEIEMEDSSLCASDTYSLASPNKLEKEVDDGRTFLTDSYNETCSADTRCWICGKSGSLTRYCVAEPSFFSCLCGNDVNKTSTPIDISSLSRRKCVKKEVLYTSDESSSEESEDDLLCSTPCCEHNRVKYD